jgi:hypothetical protein
MAPRRMLTHFGHTQQISLAAVMTFVDKFAMICAMTHDKLKKKQRAMPPGVFQLEDNFTGSQMSVRNISMSGRWCAFEERFTKMVLTSAADESCNSTYHSPYTILEADVQMMAMRPSHSLTPGRNAICHQTARSFLRYRVKSGMLTESVALYTGG